MNTILQILIQIHQAILAIQQRNNQPCNGCGGNEIEPPEVVTPGDPETDPNPTDPNFPTWDEFFDYKCKVANALLDYWSRFLHNASAWDWDTLATGGLAVVIDAVGLILVEAALAAVGITIASGPIIIAGLLIAIAVFLLTNSTLDFEDMALIIENNRADLLCILYDATGAEAAKADMEAALTGYGYTALESELFSLLANMADYNKLFELDAELENSPYVPPDDCSACEEIEFTFERDLGTSQEGNFDANDGTVVASSTWYEVGGDDIGEIAAGSFFGGNVCPACPDPATLTHVSFIAHVVSPLAQNNGQTLTIRVRDSLLVENVVYTITAGDIGSTPTQFDVPMSAELNLSGAGSDLKFHVENIGYPSDNQLQRIAIHWVGAVAT